MKKLLFISFLLIIKLNCSFAQSQVQPKQPPPQQQQPLFQFLLSSKFRANFYLFSQDKGIKHPTIVNANNLANSSYDGTKTTTFLIHGFIDSVNISSAIKIVDALLRYTEVTPIFVDWSLGAAGPDYFVAFNNVIQTAQQVVVFIRQANIDPMNVHCIGHSLGAHVCGNVGKIIKIKRISALDPAGPCFKKSMPITLTKNDAYFVDVIHTNGGFLGFEEPLGHIDFYPNGGSDQPGCSPSDIIGSNSFIRDALGQAAFLVYCNHQRAILFYARTIKSIRSSCKFDAMPCTSYRDFNANKCRCPPSGCQVMGYWTNTTTVKNKYSFYLNTAYKSPYCLPLPK